MNIVKEVENETTTRHYVYGSGIDEPFYQVVDLATDVRSYYYPDGLGSIKKVANATPQENNTYNYDVWGQPAKQTGSIPNSYGYTAREFTNTDLLYYRARYYQPGVGRFISKDPRDFADGIHFFSYVNNTPTVFRDPYGLEIYTHHRSIDTAINVLRECAEKFEKAWRFMLRNYGSTFWYDLHYRRTPWTNYEGDLYAVGSGSVVNRKPLQDITYVIDGEPGTEYFLDSVFHETYEQYLTWLSPKPGAMLGGGHHSAAENAWKDVRECCMKMYKKRGK